MLMVNQLIGFGVVGAGAATVTWASSAVSTADATVYTFSGAAIDTAAANRHVVVAINNIPNTNVVRQGASVTIGGIAATRIAQIYLESGNYPNLEIWSAAVPTGTTADIVVTWDNACVRCGLDGVWAVYGSDGTAKASDTDTRTSSGTTVSTTTTAAAGQITISAVLWSGSGTASWSSMSERYDQNIEAGSYQTGADTDATGALTETVTFSAATSEALMATVVMGP